MSTNTFKSISIDSLVTVTGGADAQTTLNAIKGVGQLTGCARQAYDSGLAAGNQGFTSGGLIFNRVGPKGLSATERASYGLDACLKGAQDAASSQQQLGL